MWADTRSCARVLLAAELDLDYMEVCDVRRYPKLDGFTGSLRRWQLANGWHWECQQCSKICYGQEEGQPDDEGPFAVLDDEDQVFCSPACRDKHRDYWAAHRAIDAAVREDFERMHPGVPVGDVWHNDHYAFVNAGAPLNRCVTVWEFVTVTQQFWPVARVPFVRHPEEPNG